jgi:epi-isozizaene synthase
LALRRISAALAVRRPPGESVDAPLTGYENDKGRSTGPEIQQVRSPSSFLRLSRWVLTEIVDDTRLAVIEAGFPRQFDPCLDRVRAASHAWLREQRLMPPEQVAKHAEALHYADLVGGYYVGGPEPVLSAIVDFSSWFFVWDDQHDQDIAHGRAGAWARRSDMLRAAATMPRAHLDNPDPLVAGFADSVRRMYGYLGDGWNARFAVHFHGVIDAYQQEFHNRATGTVPTLAEYLELRRHTFGHRVWLDALELTAQYELPPQVRDSGAYRRAGFASQDFCAWYNDLCSLPKELAAGDVHNIGISLMHHEGLTQQQATADTRRMVCGRITEFLGAELAVAALVAGAAPELRRAVRSCLFNMRNWMSSTYWFHHESRRYRVDEWADPGRPPYLSDLAVHYDK